ALGFDVHRQRHPCVRVVQTLERDDALLDAHPATCDALADLLGCPGGWAAPQGSGHPAGALLDRHPESVRALEALLAGR
ncbi:hypothetical protein AB0C77_33255, partial [Streptomyces sp. NPDC048629]|uniref:hypothetical protein n=1 Tax=Streptomyces sp. NPDC048629 TaxID=3154824 RepID=UPI00341975C0